ncbi:hypothetical protein [Nostoc sp. 'Lobaria pulmonaria (5183) cyanobiont']|uniref:hypothetical protein n=1 Tax=Nostoc sp. 'Lobaria pulmonaria (5183) cyanobiont' TaxID=1618022 RepID=UPI001319F228|nr:hypothetical protein [Nostoc sp. 'Lobaria pulmonaria (5183) cyanobiont']
MILVSCDALHFDLLAISVLLVRTDRLDAVVRRDEQVDLLDELRRCLLPDLPL